MMEIKEYNGNLFDSKAEVLCHQVNTFGVMGAGIAAEVKKRFPGVYEEYKKTCELYKIMGRSKEGKALVLKTGNEKDQYIANLFGQKDWMTEYSLLESALRDLLWWMETHGKKYVAFPYNMSCGLASGNWNIVRAMIEGIFCDTGIQVEIWRLDA